MPTRSLYSRYNKIHKIKIKKPRNALGVKRVSYKADGKIKELTVAEKSIQSHILNALLTNGFRCWRENSGFARKDGIQLAPAGTPDIIGWLPKKLVKPEHAGRFFGIEVKTAKGRQSEYQKLCQDNMLNDEAIYILARSVHDVFEGLRPYFNEVGDSQTTDVFGEKW